MGVMDRDCAACHQPIADEERWFRVREEYVHLSCSEKYLRRVSEGWVPVNALAFLRP